MKGGGGGGGNKSKGNKKGRGKANPELEAALQKWEPVIGIEIHAQLSSSTKVRFRALLPEWPPRLQHCCRVNAAVSFERLVSRRGSPSTYGARSA